MYAVNGSVVELDTLTDSDRTGTDNDYSLLLALFLGLELEVSLVLSAFAGEIICAVEIRCCSCELTCAGINHLIYRYELVGADRIAGDLLHRAVCKTELLTYYIIFVCNCCALDLLLEVNKALNLVEEPHVDLCNLVDLLTCYASVQSLADEEESLVSRLGVTFLEFLECCLFELRDSNAVSGDLSSSYCLHECGLEGIGDSHYLTCSLHLSTEVSLSVYELIERPLRELNCNVVECRLEGSICVARNGILDLIESVAQSDLGSNLRDRVTCRLGSQCGRS